jgi:uncharacterized caspase-like protein
LVIGNSAYQFTSPLTNPTNDAADMAAALKRVGFDVVEGRDLDESGMRRTIKRFAERLTGADVGLFFYAGHGLQVGGQNYLVPVDAKLESPAGLDFELIRLDVIHRTMERETKTNVIFLDACRDNPLSRNLARSMGTRSSQIGKGLAVVESGVGTLISFSTQPGNTALDGEGRNSPFAASLVKHINNPGEDLSTLLIHVRNQVMAATKDQQIPWEHSALRSKFYFVALPPAEAAKPAEPSYERRVELEYWMSLKDSSDPAVLGTYLERYPSGEFAPIARALIEHHERQLKLQAAAREEETRRREEERKAAEVKRLEEERDARRTEDLRKAVEEARLAREAAKAAEERRLAAVKAAESATAAAEQAIAKKREAQRTAGDPTKLAALPKIEAPTATGAFDGTWYLHRLGPGCRTVEDVRMVVYVANGIVSGSGPVGKITGTVSPTGQLKFSHGTWSGPNKTSDGGTMHYKASLRGNTGSGTFDKPGSGCNGTFTATRN